MIEVMKSIFFWPDVIPTGWKKTTTTTTTCIINFYSNEMDLARHHHHHSRKFSNSSRTLGIEWTIRATYHANEAHHLNLIYLKVILSSIFTISISPINSLTSGLDISGKSTLLANNNEWECNIFNAPRPHYHQVSQSIYPCNISCKWRYIYDTGGCWVKSASDFEWWFLNLFIIAFNFCLEHDIHIFIFHVHNAVHE